MTTRGDRIVYADNEDGVFVFSIAPPGQPREDFVYVRGFTGAQGRHANAVELLMTETDALALQELLKTFLAERAEKKLAPATTVDHPILGKVHSEDVDVFDELTNLKVRR